MKTLYDFMLVFMTVQFKESYTEESNPAEEHPVFTAVLAPKVETLHEAFSISTVILIWDKLKQAYEV